MMGFEPTTFCMQAGSGFGPCGARSRTVESGIRRFPALDAFRISVVCGRFLAVWALDRLLCPNPLTGA
jgi:hypothetical protein